MDKIEKVTNLINQANDSFNNGEWDRAIMQLAKAIIKIEKLYDVDNYKDEG